MKTKKEDLSPDGLREIERKIEAGLASVRRGDLIEGDDVMFELRAMSKRKKTGTPLPTDRSQ